MVTIDDHWSYCGLKAVVLENTDIRITVLPEFGANIWSILYKSKNKELLWHHPRMRPRKVSIGSNYDNVFFGGWHLVFPNDIAEIYDNEPLCDHGELWATEWEYSVEEAGETQALVLKASGPITPVEVKQTIILSERGSSFQIVYTLKNIGLNPVDFMFKLHPALRVDPGDRIDLPCETMYIENIGYPSRVPPGTTYPWPFYSNGNEQTDMSVIPPADANFSELQYGSSNHLGRCGLHKYGDRLKFELLFDPDVFRTMWTFASFGAWRGLNTIILEPATGKPASLQTAKELGTIRTLLPGEKLETVVTCRITNLDIQEEDIHEPD